MAYQIIWNSWQDGDTPGMHLRAAVFIEEQGFPYDYDELDDTSLHLTVLDEAGHAAAAARLIPNTPADGVATFGRVAVRRDLRGTGLGRLMMQAMEEKARECGMHTAHLGAQMQAAGFYLRCGYLPAGEEYDEEGVQHLPMEKKL